MYKNVNPYRARMYEISKKEDFVSIMTLFITKSKRKIIRMHESGDYYSQDYLNKWINIAENLPEVIFYAYTKSYMFDFSKRPGNFVVRLSIDKTSTQEALDKTKLFDGIAETIDKDATSTMFVCPGSCKTCNYCLAPGLDVAFHLH